jgi:hypothetical protein
LAVYDRYVCLTLEGLPGTGSYTDAAGSQHAFVRNPYGIITSFDPPEGKQTTATTISDGGAVAGFYHYKAGGPPVGFIRVP